MHKANIPGKASRKIYCFVILSVICIYEVPIYNLNRQYEFRERIRIFGTGDTNFLSHSLLQSLQQYLLS
jgi:hypothetical protein